ncbi:hypothetical protein TYRP_020887 [Tyrophagus putrescentiae]|nr:hypothetical protein TYRP_020887 [Tyrophagus putrescentiae]
MYANVYISVGCKGPIVQEPHQRQVVQQKLLLRLQLRLRDHQQRRRPITLTLTYRTTSASSETKLSRRWFYSQKCIVYIYIWATCLGQKETFPPNLVASY